MKADLVNALKVLHKNGVVIAAITVEVEDVIGQFEHQADEIERLREALREYTCDCENGCQGIRGEVCGSKARAALEEKE